MAYILAICKSGGFKNKVIGFNTMVRNVKPYAIVGFDLHAGGGQVGALNAPCFSQDVCLMHFFRVSMSFIWYLFLFGGRSYALGGNCAYHAEQRDFP